LNIITQIEKDLDTESLNINGFNVWQGLKGYLWAKLVNNTDAHQSLGWREMLKLLASSFFGFKNYFKNHKYWFFTSSINRRLVHGKLYDTYCDYPATSLGNSLVIETPIYSLAAKRDIKSKHRISSFPLILAERLLAKFYSIPNNHKLHETNNYLKDFNSTIDILPICKRMYAQYLVMNFLLRFKKPEVVFIIAPYTKTGYVRAFKERGIKVVEPQHGVINKEHYGYNSSIAINDMYLPDVLLTFGENEEKIFKNNKIKIRELYVVGRFYCDYMNESFESNIEIEKLKIDYKKTIAVSLQDNEVGLKLVQFVIDAAKKQQNILYLLKARKTPIAVYLAKFNFPSNVVFNELQDVYETILSADFHVSANSSCILEAPAMGVRNIAVDIDGMATKYFGEQFKNSQNTLFVKEIDEFLAVIESEKVLEKMVVKNEHKGIISPNYKTRINNFLKQLEAS